MHISIRLTPFLMITKTVVYTMQMRVNVGEGETVYSAPVARISVVG